MRVDWRRTGMEEPSEARGSRPHFRGTMVNNILIVSLAAVSGLLVGCGNGDDNVSTAPVVDGGPGGADAKVDAAAALDAGPAIVAVNVDAACPVIVSDSACDKTQRPIVFVHGTYSAAGDIMNVSLLFGSNGYCQDRFVAVDYDSLGDTPFAQLDVLIDKVLADTGFAQVDIMGHSQGALQIYNYLGDADAGATRAAKIAHYVQLAGGPHPGPPAGIPTLSLSSLADTVAGPVGVTGAQQTVVLETEDHFGVAASTDSFVAIWQYLHQGVDGGPDGQYPKYTTIQCGDDPVTIEGKVETFGDNVLQPDDKIVVYEVGSTPRDEGAPVATFSDPPDGGSFAWQAKRLQGYDFVNLGADGGVLAHNYFEPFKRSNRIMRFLVPSTNASAALVTNPIGKLNDDSQSAFLVRNARGAFRQDLGDSVTVDGFEALNTQDANKATTTVGLFLFDANKDKKSEGGSLSQYLSPVTLPFVRGSDVYVQAGTPAFVEVTFNGKAMIVPNWPSKSEGQIQVYFQ